MHSHGPICKKMYRVYRGCEYDIMLYDSDGIFIHNVWINHVSVISTFKYSLTYNFIIAII